MTFPQKKAPKDYQNLIFGGSSNRREKRQAYGVDRPHMALPQRRESEFRAETEIGAG
jgi:hypothetical protein